MQEDLILLENWFSANYLLLNVFKTNYIIFKGDLLNIHLSMNGVSLERAHCLKYLGLYIDSNLKWNIHIKHILSKINSVGFAIFKVRKWISEEVAWKIYNAHINSYLNYMNCVWGYACQTYLLPLQRAQNRILKTIKNLPYMYPSRELYSSRILSLQNIYFYELLLIIYRIKYNLTKCNIDLISVSQIHSISTRNQGNYYVPMVRSKLASKNIFNIGLIIFNNLPQNLKSELSIKKYKFQLREYIYANSDRLKSTYL